MGSKKGEVLSERLEKQVSIFMMQALPDDYERASTHSAEFSMAKPKTLWLGLTLKMGERSCHDMVLIEI